MKIKENQFILIFLLLILVSACNKSNNNYNDIFSKKIETNLKNVNINFGLSDVTGPIEFIVSSPIEIKQIKLNTKIPHKINLERIKFKPNGSESKFVQSINWDSDELSEEENQKINDTKQIQHINDSIANSETAKKLYIYNATLIFNINNYFLDKETIKEMLVYTDNEHSIDVGTINVLNTNDKKFENYSFDGPLIRNISQSFDRVTLPNEKKSFNEKFGNNEYQFETTSDIVIDSIYPINDSIIMKDINIDLDNNAMKKKYSFTEDQLENTNIKISNKSKFSINVNFEIKTKNRELFYVQSYDYFIKYHDTNGKKYIKFVDSGYIFSQKDVFAIISNDDIKNRIIFHR